MRPTLVSLHFGEHQLRLPGYGVLVALGFAVGIFLFWREGRREGFDRARLLDLSFWSIVSGMIGSRVAFVLLNAQAFAAACFDRGGVTDGRIAGCTAIFRFWEGGFVYYGGVLATGCVVFFFCRREGWSFWRLGDLAAPTLAIGHAIGRLGCFLAGCCFGKPCAAAWAVTFPPRSVAYDELQSVGVLVPGAARSPALHPTQLYEALGEFTLFGVLLILRAYWRRDGSEQARDSRRPGGLLLTYAAGYAIVRFAVEIFRGDVSRRYLMEWTSTRLASALGLPPDQPLMLSVSQFASVLIVLAVGVVMIDRRRRTQITTRHRGPEKPGP